MSGLVHVLSGSGHRAEYQALFASKFDLAEISGNVSWHNLRRFIQADRMLFATIDDDLPGYFFVAMLRAILGRRTAGLYLRPHSCFQRGWKASVKYAAFGLLCRIPKIKTLSILPTELFPEQVAVVNGWIHDPQLWDLHGCSEVADSDMRLRLNNIAGSRLVIAFLGQVSPIKGFSLLAEMVNAYPDLTDRFCIVVAGEISECCKANANRLQQMGVEIWPRRLTEAEMVAVYQGATFLWACYDPSYDQASGIFGRAVQRGRVAIVREGAMLESYAKMLGYRVLTLPYSAAEAGLLLTEAAIASTYPANSAQNTMKRYHLSIDTIWSAL